MTVDTAPELDYDQRYEEVLQRYEAGEAMDGLIPPLVALRRERADIRVAVALSWLYTLTGKRDEALRYAREAKAVAQGRYNHALALLTFNEKGVREKLEEAYRLGGEQGRQDAMDNLRDALKRKGGLYPAATKMLQWLETWS